MQLQVLLGELRWRSWLSRRYHWGIHHVCIENRTPYIDLQPHYQLFITGLL